MRIGTSIIITAVAATALAACGGDDADEPSGNGGTGSPGADMAAAAAELDLSCTFEPYDNPDIIGAGVATVTGANTTDQRIDILTMTVTLTADGTSVDSPASVPYFMPGEELALWSPVGSDAPGDDPDCEITNVSGGHYADVGEIDPEAASCTVEGEPGSWDLVADLSGVEGVPADAGKFVGVVAQVDGKRYTIDELELPAGETTLTASANAPTEPACAVRYVRDL